MSNTLKDHWNQVYANKPIDKLGWYETDLNPTLQLVNKTNLPLDARIINIGAGSTTLVDELLNRGYSNLIATDISKVALANLKDRVGENNIEFIVDDITNSKKLTALKPIDLWIDRAVLHFFTDEVDRKNYFDLLRNCLKKGAYAIIAQFNTNSAKFCSGLPVYQYDKEMLEDQLKDDFTLIDAFDYEYTTPSGAIRNYIYTLFKRV